MDKQNEYKKIFIQESDELLQQMNQNLLILEKEPRNTEALNAIFRSAHTLKSMSASMGYIPISELAHKMEDLLSQLRSGLLEVSQTAVDLMFKGFDSLESMAGLAHEDKEIKKDIGPLMAELAKIMIQAPEVKDEKTETGFALNVFDKKTLLRVKKDGYHCFNIDIELDKNCVLKSVRAFMIFRNLHEIGEVIKSYPDSQALEEEKFKLNFSCVFITKEKKQKIEKKVLEILDVAEVKVKEVDIPDSWEEEVFKEEAVSGIQPAAALDESGRPAENLRKIQSVRVDIKRLDKLMNLVEELAINKLRLIELGHKSADIELRAIIEELSRLTENLQAEVMQARLVPVGQIFERFPRLVRDLAKKENKLVRLDVTGSDIELDRTVLDEIGDPLIHLLRNSIDHGIEPPQDRKKSGKTEEGRIMLIARREKSYVYIEVEDDGKGFDVDEIKKTALSRGILRKEVLDSMSRDEILMLATQPGFSTSEKVTEVSGRGVGLDAAKQKTEILGGGLSIETKAGRGTKISLRLPITTAVVQALLVAVDGSILAVPVSGITEIVGVRSSDIKTIEGKETIMHRNGVLPIVRLDRLFQPSAVKIVDSRQSIVDSKNYSLTTIDNRLNIVVVESGKIEFGIVVEKLIGQHDIVIKQLSKELRGVKGFAGATILGDGSVALVLDVATLI